MHMRKEAQQGNSADIMEQILTKIGFDAEDTLWHNGHFFRMMQDRFAELSSLAELHDFVRSVH